MPRGACVHVHVHLKFGTWNRMLNKHNYYVVSVRGAALFLCYSAGLQHQCMQHNGIHGQWMKKAANHKKKTHFFLHYFIWNRNFHRIKWNWRATAWKARPLFKWINDICRVLEFHAYHPHTHALPIKESTATGNEYYTTKRNASKQRICKLWLWPRRAAVHWIPSINYNRWACGNLVCQKWEKNDYSLATWFSLAFEL